MVDKLAVPRKDGVRLRHGRDLLEDLLTELLTKLSEASAIIIRQLYTAGDLLAQQTILCLQVCITQQKLFVNRCSDRPEEFLPVHSSLTLAKTAFIDEQYGRKRREIQDEA